MIGRPSVPVTPDRQHGFDKIFPSRSDGDEKHSEGSHISNKSAHVNQSGIRCQNEQQPHTEQDVEATTEPHRSTSPNTMSSALSTAVVSASMWPFIMKSIAWRCEKPVGRILQRYGRLVPSATR